MDKVIKMILVKYFIIVTLVLIYVAIALAYIGPAINHAAFGQSAFDTPNQFNPDPYNQQYGMQQQYQQPYQQQYGYNQYQQPYQQPYYGNQQYIPQAQNPIQFGTSEVIYTLLGGGAIGYARYNQHKRNQDKEVQRDLAAELLKEKLEKREFARVAYQQMPNQGNDIKDAPNIRLQKLDTDIQELSEKVSKI